MYNILWYVLDVNPPHYIPVVEVVPAPWTEEFKSVIDKKMTWDNP